jgi:hypothetical protein
VTTFPVGTMRVGGTIGDACYRRCFPPFGLRRFGGSGGGFLPTGCGTVGVGWLTTFSMTVCSLTTGWDSLLLVMSAMVASMTAIEPQNAAASRIAESLRASSARSGSLLRACSTAARGFGACVAASIASVRFRSLSTGHVTLARIEREGASEDALAFIDAPLVIANPARRRPCEEQVGQRYWQFKVSANSTKLASPRQAGVRLRQALELAEWRHDDGIAGPRSDGRTVSECYPYMTIVGAAKLGHDVERRRCEARLRRRAPSPSLSTTSCRSNCDHPARALYAWRS